MLRQNLDSQQGSNISLPPISQGLKMGFVLEFGKHEE